MGSTLRTAKIHTAIDGELVLDTFEFGEPTPFTNDDPDHSDRLKEMISYAAEHMQDVTADQVQAFFARSSEEYIMTVTPLRMAKHWKLVDLLSGTDGTSVELERETDPTLSRIVVAVSNSTRRSMLQRIATRLSKSRVNIHRAYLDSIDDGQNGWITLIGCVVQGLKVGQLTSQVNSGKKFAKIFSVSNGTTTEHLNLATSIQKSDCVKLNSSQLCSIFHIKSF